MTNRCNFIIVIMVFLFVGKAFGATPSQGCASLPEGNNHFPENVEWLQKVISADVLNISADDSRKTYMYRLSGTVKEWLNFDCTYSLDMARINQLEEGISKAFHADGDWNASFSRVNKFKTEAEDDALASILEASYWIEYAWNARGSGFISSVTPDGYKLFLERLEMAESVLIKNKDVASVIPTWYSLMVQVQTGLGRPYSVRQATFIEGAKRYPRYYGLYKTIRYFSLPKWGGNWQSMDAFIKWTAQNTQQVWGDRAYARLYSGLRFSMGNGENIFKVTPVDWDRMQRGLAEELARNPTSKFDLNDYAAAACEANDKTTYRMLRQRIGAIPSKYGWTITNPVELCDAKFEFAP